MRIERIGCVVRRWGWRPLGLLALAGVWGCGSHPALELSPPQQLSAEVRAVLDTDWRSPAYQQARAQLEELGPELDWLLVGLVEDSRARLDARANALILLADRRSPFALPTLQRTLLESRNEYLRSAAVLGLQALTDNSEIAAELIRRATEDRSPAVRLTALQSLDIGEVAALRRVLANEGDPEVRLVALQLVYLAELRGAPLGADRRGALRPVTEEEGVEIVFRPVSYDSASAIAYGDLRLEPPDAPDLPLAGGALVVGAVVPAFFSPDRGSVVFEASGEIRVVEVATRAMQSYGHGLAPRLVPFTQLFVFLRERPGWRQETPEGTEIVYEVLQATFGVPGAEPIGLMRAWMRPDRDGGETPVRRMVVGEVVDGFVLRGEGVEPFPLPNPIWRTGSGGGDLGAVR